MSAQARRVRLLDLPPELLGNVASLVDGKDLVSLMQSCTTMCQLVQQEWSATAPPCSGSMAVRARSPGAAAAWARFFRCERMPVRQLRLDMRDAEEEEGAHLLARVAHSCGASLQHLELTDSWFRRQALASLSSLRSLGISVRYDTGFDVEDDEFWHEPVAMTELDFRSMPGLHALTVRVDSNHFAVIDTLLLPPHLRRLTLDLTHVSIRDSHAVCRHLASLPALSELTVTGYSDFACPHLLELRSLTKLAFSSPFSFNGADDWKDPGGTDCLPTSLRHLELQLQEWEQADSPLQCMQPLSRLTGLTHLSLTYAGVPMTGPMLECLAPLQQLEQLILHDSSSPSTLAPLASLRSLTLLCLSVDGRLDFAAALPVLSRMAAVNLRPLYSRDLAPLLRQLTDCDVTIL